MTEEPKTHVDIVVTGVAKSVETIDPKGRGIEIGAFIEPPARRNSEAFCLRIPDPRRIPELEKRIKGLIERNQAMETTIRDADYPDSPSPRIAELEKRIAELERENSELLKLTHDQLAPPVPRSDQRIAELETANKLLREKRKRKKFEKLEADVWRRILEYETRLEDLEELFRGRDQ